jgi:hypothetical protein
LLEFQWFPSLLKYASPSEKISEEYPTVEEKKAMTYLSDRNVDQQNNGLCIKYRPDSRQKRIQQCKEQKKIDKNIGQIIIRTAESPQSPHETSL